MGDFNLEEYFEELRERGLEVEKIVTINVGNPLTFLAMLPEEVIEKIYQINIETENYEFCQIIKEFREKKNKTECKS
jgi:uncharacterized protein YbgA (DUF1722 family)